MERCSLRYGCDVPGCTADATVIHLGGIASQYRRPRRPVFIKLRCPEHDVSHAFWVTIDTWWFGDGRERVWEHAGWRLVDRVERQLHRQRV
jgi:hypothetical protein